MVRVESQLAVLRSRDDVQDVGGVILVGEVLQQRFSLCGSTGCTSRASRKCCGRRFSILFVRGLLDFVLPDDEAVLDGNVELEVVPFETMSKALLRTTGIKADDADIGWLAEQNVGPDVLVLGDFALFGGAERGHHIDGRR